MFLFGFDQMRSLRRVWVQPLVSVQGSEMISERRQPCSARIFVEPSDYVLRNVVDMAMLRTALSRLVQKCPGTTTGSK